jgi:uncharacterized protein (DUF2249 family)
VELTAETRLAKVLDAIPGALDYVVALNPHDFSRLTNPNLRKYMAPRISLGRIAAMVNMPEERLLHDLAALAGDTVQVGASTATAARPHAPAIPPPWLATAEATGLPLHQVDVLTIDDAAGDPLPPINMAIKRLAPGATLVIRHRWEPQPLYDIWTKMGLEWYARQESPEAWQIFVHRPPGVLAGGAEITPTVDLRHLPPAERAPRLIAMFEQLRPGEALAVLAEPADWLDGVRAAFEQAHPTDADWQQTPGTDRLTIRIVRPSP